SHPLPARRVPVSRATGPVRTGMVPGPRKCRRRGRLSPSWLSPFCLSSISTVRVAPTTAQGFDKASRFLQGTPWCPTRRSLAGTRSFMLDQRSAPMRRGRAVMGRLLARLLDHLDHRAIPLGFWGHGIEQGAAASLDGFCHEAVVLAVEPVVVDGVQYHRADLVGVLAQWSDEHLETLELLPRSQEHTSELQSRFE